MAASETLGQSKRLISPEIEAAHGVAGLPKHMMSVEPMGSPSAPSQGTLPERTGSCALRFGIRRNGHGVTAPCMRLVR